MEAQVGAGGLEALVEGAAVGGELADALFEGGVLGGDPLDGFLGPLNLQVADLAKEFADASALGEDLGVGGLDGVLRKQYAAYQRLRDFACVCPPQQTKLLVYLKVNPKEVDLVAGFTRDVTGLGHHGTGDLELQLRTERDLERAHALFRLSYAAA